MRHARTFALLPLLLLLAVTARAQPTWTVELLAFEHPTTASSDPAVWGFDATPPAPAVTTAALPSPPGRLGSIAGRLASNGYPQVAHVAWSQAVERVDSAVPTAIAGGPGLGGYLKVWRGRYLHIEADLHYRGSAGGIPREGRLRVRRKVPAGQPVYLDHELFGVVLMLSR